MMTVFNGCMYMNEPSKSLYFRSGFFSIILFAAATLLFLTKPKRGYLELLYLLNFFLSQPLTIFIQHFNEQNIRHVN